MKHVGLNVAADAFMTLACVGVKAGMVIVVADDPLLHSSQNEQDTRYYAKMAGVPMLEPATPEETVAAVPSLARVEWEHIQRVLADCGGNISQAAKLLGLHRRSLQRKLAKYPPRL